MVISSVSYPIHLLENVTVSNIIAFRHNVPDVKFKISSVSTTPYYLTRENIITFFIKEIGKCPTKSHSYPTLGSF
jgi:hypothetical protein